MSQLSGLVRDLLTHLFETEAGKGQRSKPIEERRALYFRVETHTNYDIEEGYRWAECVLYAGLNYVETWSRDCWNVAPLKPDEEDNCDLDYEEGDSGWDRVGYHDSCWRDTLERFFTTRDVIHFKDSISGAPYEAVTLEQLKGMDLVPTGAYEVDEPGFGTRMKKDD